MEFFETSAKSNTNVNETFTFLTKEILKNSETKTKNGNIIIDDKDKKNMGKKGKCC